MHGLRASFEIDPNDADLIELRLRVMRGDKNPGHRNLAVSMDRQLSSAPSRDRDCSAGRHAAENPLPMPRRTCATNRPPRRERAASRAAVLFARFILITTVTLGVTTYGIYQMLQVVRFASMTLLQGLMIFFFAVSLGWIAFSAGSVLAGASKRRDPVPRPIRAMLAHRAGHADLQRRSARTTDRAAGDGRGARAKIGAQSRLRDRGSVRLDRRRCVDSRDPERRPAAQCARTVMPVWYRRRWQNIARKSGNVEDFVKRWGGRYDHMIVLDADSLIDAPTLLRLAEAMQADPTSASCRPLRS
jgi:membrane glycosyltransferase